jgi:hypothetical protein
LKVLRKKIRLIKRIRTSAAAIDKRKKNKQQQQDEIEYWQPFYFTHGNTQDMIGNNYFAFQTTDLSLI